MKSVAITVFGRVQGVGFRYFVHRLAGELGVRGFVQNRPDRSVYIEAEGPEELLEVFAHRCAQGPSHARVAGHRVVPIPPQGFSGFAIK